MNENKFEDSIELYIEDLEIGQEASIISVIKNSDIVSFSKITGDYNPVHLDNEYAKKTIFKKKIAHGFLTASLISAVIGTKLPGPGSIYVTQSLKFYAPVFIGDEIETKVVVQLIDKERKRVTLKTFCKKKEKIILDGEATILVQSKNI